MKTLSQVDLSRFFFSPIDGRTRAKLLVTRQRETIIQSMQDDDEQRVSEEKEAIKEKEDFKHEQQADYEEVGVNEEGYIQPIKKDREQIIEDNIEKLKEVHAKNYMGTDDDMPDNFEYWLENLSDEEIKNLVK